MRPRAEERSAPRSSGPSQTPPSVLGCRVRRMTRLAKRLKVVPVMASRTTGTGTVNVVRLGSGCSAALAYGAGSKKRIPGALPARVIATLPSGWPLAVLAPRPGAKPAAADARFQRHTILGSVGTNSRPFVRSTSFHVFLRCFTKPSLTAVTGISSACNIQERL